MHSWAQIRPHYLRQSDEITRSDLSILTTAWRLAVNESGLDTMSAYRIAKPVLDRHKMVMSDIPGVLLASGLRLCTIAKRRRRHV